MLLIKDNVVIYLSNIFPELKGYKIKDFYPSYFGAKKRLQKELGCPITDILVLAFLALEDLKTTAYALRRLKEVQLLEKGA